MSSMEMAVSKDLGQLEGRVASLEAWQERQNGHLQRIDEKLDSLMKWLVGLLGSTIVSLVLLIVNLWLQGGR